MNFIYRKDKEHVLWRSRDKLRKAGIMVTEDSTTRLLKLRALEEEKEAKMSPMKTVLPKSPSKKSPTKIRRKKV